MTSTDIKFPHLLLFHLVFYFSEPSVRDACIPQQVFTYTVVLSNCPFQIRTVGCYLI